MRADPIVLGIESSCDDTAAAVIRGDEILANVVASQAVHKAYGGVVPELAARAHQQHIVPVVHQALCRAKVSKKEVDAVAFTQGPGLISALLVGTSFAKSLALAWGVPLLAVNHMRAHILAHFIADANAVPPSFPFLALTVSGGHTQIVLVKDYFTMEVIGQTCDDAVGEAFDKIAKLLRLSYPGGAQIDALAQKGNPEAFSFPKPRVKGLDFSFSGLKTAVCYFLQEQLKRDPDFIDQRIDDLAASVQHILVEILLDKLSAAAEACGIAQIALAGGVSANSGLRRALCERAAQHHWRVYLPKLEYTTDNAAMVAMAGRLKLQEQRVAPLDTEARARFKL